MAAIVAAAVGITFSVAKFADTNTGMYVIAPVALIGAVVFLYVVANAAMGRRWALITFLFLLTLLIDASFRQRDLGDFSPDWQTVLKLVSWCGALFIGLMRIRHTMPILLRPPGVFLAVFATLCVLSTIYSRTPTYTIASAVGLLGITLFCAAVVQLLTVRDLLLTLTAALGFFILFSWVIVVLWPETGFPASWTESGPVHRMAGLAPDPNLLGRIGVLFLGGLFVLGRIRQVQARYLILPAALGLVTLGLTQSRTAAASLIGAVIMISLRRRAWLILPLAISGIIVVALFSYSGNLLPQFLEQFSRSGTGQDVFTFTGRTDIWRSVIGIWLQSPWIGYGLGASRLLIPAVYANSGGFTAPHAHNMLLENLLSVGVIGTIPLGLALWNQGASYVRTPNLLRDTYFWMVLITGVLEAGAMGLSPNSMTIFWLATLFCAQVSPNGRIASQGTSAKVGGQSHRLSTDGSLHQEGKIRAVS